MEPAGKTVPGMPLTRGISDYDEADLQKVAENPGNISVLMSEIGHPDAYFARITKARPEKDIGSGKNLQIPRQA